MTSEIVKEICHYCRLRSLYGTNHRMEVFLQLMKDLLRRIQYSIDETIPYEDFTNRRKLIIVLIKMLIQEYKNLEIKPDDTATP